MPPKALLSPSMAAMALLVSLPKAFLMDEPIRSRMRLVPATSTITRLNAACHASSGSRSVSMLGRKAWAILALTSEASAASTLSMSPDFVSRLIEVEKSLILPARSVSSN